MASKEKQAETYVPGSRLLRMSFTDAEGKPVLVRVGGDDVVAHAIQNVDPRFSTDDLQIFMGQYLVKVLRQQGMGLVEILPLEVTRARTHLRVVIRQALGKSEAC